MLSAGGKCTLSFANTHYNYVCLSRYYNLELKKRPHSEQVVPHCKTLQMCYHINEIAVTDREIINPQLRFGDKIRQKQIHTAT